MSATNELMRQLLTNMPEADQRHLIEVVDQNHADQLARKRRSGALVDDGSAAQLEVGEDLDATDWDPDEA